MSKFLKAYLVQGNKKYGGISSIDMTTGINSGNTWEIELKMDDVKNVQNLTEDWKKNQMFNLYVEFIVMKKDKTNIETATGEMLIAKIGFDSRKLHNIKGFASNIKFSSKKGIIPEKVQFT